MTLTMYLNAIKSKTNAIIIPNHGMEGNRCKIVFETGLRIALSGFTSFNPPTFTNKPDAAFATTPMILKKY